MRQDLTPAEILRAWEERVGPFVTVAEAEARLAIRPTSVSTGSHVSRPIALARRGGGSLYPAWQFDLEEPARTALVQAHAVLVAHGRVSPWTAAAWFTARQPALDDRTPVEFLGDGGDPAALIHAARVDAARIAQ